MGAVWTLFLPAPITTVPLLQSLSQSQSACNQMLSVGKLRKEMSKTARDRRPRGPGAGTRHLTGIWLYHRISEIAFKRACYIQSSMCCGIRGGNTSPSNTTYK